MNRLEIEISGMRLDLHPKKVAFWREAETLFVADVHLGKGESMRSQGFYLPSGADCDDLEQLKKTSHDLNAKHIIVLGDLFHDSFALNARSIETFKAWQQGLDIPVTLIVGNHDAKGLLEIRQLPIKIELAGIEAGPFWLSHEPEQKNGLFNICGHLHPGIRFKDAAGCSHRSKAFWHQKKHLVLPAFGSTTSMGNVSASSGDMLYTCSDESVIPIKAK